MQEAEHFTGESLPQTTEKAVKLPKAQFFEKVVEVQTSVGERQVEHVDQKPPISRSHRGGPLFHR